MNSYQKRKLELKEMTDKRWEAESEFNVLKHVVLAIARGQITHAKTVFRHFEKNRKIPNCEIKEIKKMLEKMEIV